MTTVTCETVKIDSNSVGLNYAVEECLGTLPSNPKWQALEPNSYSDFGGELTTISRSPISASRQNKKGAVTDLSASVGFGIDFTQNNLNKLLEGLFFANTRAKAKVNVTAVKATGFTVANSTIKENDIVLGQGFKSSALNTIHVAGASTGTNEVKKSGLTASSGETATLQVVGHQFAAGDLQFHTSNGRYWLSTTTKSFLELGLTNGEWIFVGGDTDDVCFATVGTFFARVGKIQANRLDIDDCTLSSTLSQNDAGNGKTVQIFFGDVLRNETDPALQVRKSYTFERTLGKRTADKKDQAEYVSGAILGEFSLKVNQGELVTADLKFTATDAQYRAGDLLSKDKLTPSKGESAFNSVHNVRSMRLSLIDKQKSVSAPLFAYVTELSLEINNNLSENKAIGVMGAIDVSAGNFDVKGSTTAYFATIEAQQAVRDYADAGLHTIFTNNNAGFMWDIPLLGLGGGQNSVEKDNPITISLDIDGAENENGYTVMYINFPYLPTVAM